MKKRDFVKSKSAKTNNITGVAPLHSTSINEYNFENIDGDHEPS